MRDGRLALGEPARDGLTHPGVRDLGSYPVSAGAGGTGPLRGDAGAAAGCAATKASTSRRTIRPPGPVPVTAARSMPELAHQPAHEGAGEDAAAAASGRGRRLRSAARRAAVAAGAVGGGSGRSAVRASESRRPAVAAEPGGSSESGRRPVSPTAAEDGDRVRRPRRQSPAARAARSTMPVGLGLVLDDAPSRSRSRRAAAPMATCRRSADRPALRARPRWRRRAPRASGSMVAISLPPRRPRRPLESGDDLFGPGDRRALEHLARCWATPRRRSPAATGWSSQSKKRRWISSASQPPYEVPRAPCSTMSTVLVLRMLSPIVSQSMLTPGRASAGR